MATAPLPRLLLTLQTAGGDVDLATWELHSDDAIKDPGGQQSIGHALAVLNEYEPQDPPPPIP